MHSAVSELLDLAPLKKVMFSTDGYAFPETYFLGIKWTREILLNVLGEACANGDLSLDEALEAATDILGRNAIDLYRLNNISESENHQTSGLVDFGVPNNCEANVKHIRLLWSDTAGHRRCKVVPKERYDHVIKEHGTGVTMCCMGVGSHDHPAKDCGLSPVGEVRLVPDTASARVIPWSRGEELVLVDMHLKSGCAWEFCPRLTLKHLIEVFYAEYGLEMKAGFESEFYILKYDPENKLKWIGLDTTPFCSSTSFDAASSILFEISEALNAMGIRVEQLHAEAGGGQFEIAVQYGPCLKAADDVLILRETVKAVVQRQGLLATFLPKLFPNDVGSGSHVHVSIWEGEKNVFMGDTDASSQYGMSQIGQEFMAGVLHHLPSILALTAPLPNSYERIKPQTWSGAYYCWGRENREAPLRTSCPPGTYHDSVSNFEFKSIDGCANPHLSLAAILAAGMDGLRRHLQLPVPIDVDPSSLTDGSVQLLPTSLDQSVKALEQNEVLKEYLGLPLVKCIIGVRQSEIEYYKENKNTFASLAGSY
ncbi:hypothetical protein KP509_01G080100 [Ceratopteris richardii]|nr:hypothetical protein KP509_01G080100 [Ceratopteris richardii]